jgi:GT2 family glycosyltransferase
MRVSFIVVSWNGSQFIEKCIQSAMRSHLSSQHQYAEVVVLDNGSSDAGVTSEVATGLGARFVGLDRNLGVADAWNRAVDVATGDALIFVNQDAGLSLGCADAMAGRIAAEPPPFVVGAKIYFPRGKVIQHAGAVIHLPQCFTKHRGYNQLDRGQFDTPALVDYVAGAVFGCSRRTIELLDGFDARFFPAYYEDVDFCWRVWSHGGTVLYLPNAMAYHEEASSLGVDSLEFFEMYNRNRLLFVSKHLAGKIALSDYVDKEVKWLENLDKRKYRVAVQIFRAFGSEGTEPPDCTGNDVLKSASSKILSLVPA